MGLFSKDQTQWKFAPILNIEEANFNRILERFYGLGVKGLVKENIQNSLDGRLINDSLPVVVKIETGDINTNDIPGINEVIDHIKSLRGRNSYTIETINHMLDKVNQRKVRYISFEDINTKGLTGAKNGQSNSKDDTWGIYAYTKGVHFEESDADVETTRGGSHGVGKIASNAASDLHIMYFANCDTNGDQHLGGSVQVIEHLYKNQCYRATGYFTDERNESGKIKYYPYKNNFHSVFQKKTRGLKIVIPYLREEFDDEDEIIRSVCDSFFVSILESRLEVQVNTYNINAKTIEDYVDNSKYYERDITNMKKVFTPLYIRTYKTENPKDLIISNGERDFKFKLYFNYDESIPKGRVAIVRTIGMKIEDFAVKSNATKPYNAILIGGVEEDGYLKSLENESHTKISHEHIRDPKLKKHAIRFINKISTEIAVVIDEVMRERNPIDGEMDTKDLLYVVESQFKQDLSKSYATIKINKGKHLVQTPTPPTPNPRKKGTKTGAVNPKSTGTKRTRKKGPEGFENGLQESLDMFKIKPDIVDRAIVKEDEFIQFDFKGNADIKNTTSCNLSFNIIDGMGVEYENEFSITDSYNTITDMNTGSELQVNNQFIQKLSIKDGIAKLKLKLKPNFNRALKFIYYVEV